MTTQEDWQQAVPLAAWCVVRFGAEAAEENTAGSLSARGIPDRVAQALAQNAVGEVCGWPEDRLQAVAGEFGAARAAEAAQMAAATAVSPAVDGILVDSFAREVLSDQYIWTAGLGWLRWQVPVWAPVEYEHIREQVRLWALRKHRAAYKALNDAMKRGASGGEIEALEARIGAWKQILMRGRLEALAALARGKVLRRAEEFDAHPDLLNCPNGVVDLRTGQRHNHDPALLLTKVTRAAYNPDAVSADWNTALTAIPEDARGYVQLRMGQAITGYKPPDDVVMVQIGGGENGKTTVSTAVRSALGPGYYVVISPRVLLADENAHPTELMDLRGARIGVLEETPEEHKLSMIRLKLVTGEHITARLIRQNTVTFLNTCSIIVSTNYYPVVREVDHGTWRRLLALVWPYRFRKPHEPLQGDYDRTGDPTLRERLSHGNGEAVLAWLVAGAVRWYRGDAAADGKSWIRPPMTMGQPAARVEQDTLSWRQRSDLVLNYISDHIVFDPARHVMSDDLLADFNTWIGDRYQQWPAELLADRFGSHPVVTEHGVQKGRKYRKDTGLSRPEGYAAATDKVRFRAWSGIRFRTRADDLDESEAAQDEEASRKRQDPETPAQAGYGTGGTTSPVYTHMQGISLDTGRGCPTCPKIIPESPGSSCMRWPTTARSRGSAPIGARC